MAIGLSALAILWGLVMTSLVGQYLGGIEAILIMLAIGIIAYILLVKSMFFEKDHSIISWVLFVPITVVLGFWVLFAIGEVLFPH